MKFVTKRIYNNCLIIDLLLIILLIIITIIIIILYCLFWDSILLCEPNNLKIDKLNGTVLVEIRYSQLFYIKPKYLDSFYGNTWESFLTKSEFSSLYSTSYVKSNDLPLAYWNIKYEYPLSCKVLDYPIFEAWPEDARIKLPIKIKHIYLMNDHLLNIKLNKLCNCNNCVSNSIRSILNY
jgi:hypothetical protein